MGRATNLLGLSPRIGASSTNGLAVCIVAQVAQALRQKKCDMTESDSPGRGQAAPFRGAADSIADPADIDGASRSPRSILFLHKKLAGPEARG
jgi:hypothetical protein